MNKILSSVLTLLLCFGLVDRVNAGIAYDVRTVQVIRTAGFLDIAAGRECMGPAKQAGIYLCGWETGFRRDRSGNSPCSKYHIADIKSHLQHK